MMTQEKAKKTRTRREVLGVSNPGHNYAWYHLYLEGVKTQEVFKTSTSFHFEEKTEHPVAEVFYTFKDYSGKRTEERKIKWVKIFGKPEDIRELAIKMNEVIITDSSDEDCC